MWVRIPRRGPFMLFDKGLATEKDRDNIKASIEYRKTHTACMDRAICQGCFHLIVDSICMCLPIFTCPNCGFENGERLKIHTGS